MPLPLARNSVIMIMIYVACYDVCYIFLYMEDIMVYVLHISIWKTVWYMYSAAAGAFMRYAGGRLGRWGCSRLLNRVAPSGGDGGLHVFIMRRRASGAGRMQGEAELAQVRRAFKCIFGLCSVHGCCDGASTLCSDVFAVFLSA